MSVFQFKRFAVDQSGCAMRINTDGVLLGAMVAAHSPKRILDVGTGTGVISLMLAQRFPAATVDAVEIDVSAADTARRNFEDSPFAARLTSRAVSLVDFEPEGPYDVIVSNPPFFLRSLHNDDRRKRIARHTDMAFFDELLARSKRWLNPKGSLQLILPPDLAGAIGRKAEREFALRVQKTIAIRSFAFQPPIRGIISLRMPVGNGIAREAEEHEFIIYERRNVYSAAYRELLKPFFLAF